MPGLESAERRILERGPQALEESELLALVLNGGHQGGSPLEAASDLLDRVGGLDALLAADHQKLNDYNLTGNGKAKVLAMAELCRRWSHERIRRKPFSRPAAVVDYVMRRYRSDDQEILGAFFLDPGHRLIAEREIFRGGLGFVFVEPRQILREALKQRAAGVLIFHNHPSGDPTPSDEDWVFTRRLATAAELVGIQLVDHLVIGDRGRWTSMKRVGGW